MNVHSSIDFKGTVGSWRRFEFCWVTIWLFNVRSLEQLRLLALAKLSHHRGGGGGGGHRPGRIVLWCCFRSAQLSPQPWPKCRDIPNVNLVQSGQDLRLGQRVIFQQDNDPEHKTTQDGLRDKSSSDSINQASLQKPGNVHWLSSSHQRGSAEKRSRTSRSEKLVTW